MNKTRKYAKMTIYSIFILGLLLVSSSFSSLPKPEYKLNIGEFGIFRYEEVNSEITILGLRDGIKNDDPRVVDMIIPDEIDGKPVITIGEDAFKRKPIRTLTMGNNVKIIENSAFEDAMIEGVLDLRNVNVVNIGGFSENKIESLIGNNLIEVGGRSFDSNYNLTTVSLDKLETMGGWAFRDTNLKELNLPKLTSIGNRALTGNKNLKELSAPELKVASRWSFYGIEAEKITLPKLEIADEYSFYMIKVRDTLELPSLKEAKIDSFQLANIEGGVRVPALEIVNDASFFGAQIGDKIDLSSATDIKYHAFKQSSINRLILSDKVQIEEFAFEVKTIHKGIIKIEGDDWSNIIPGDDPIVNGYQFEGWYLEPKSIFTTEETDGGISITGLQSWVKPDHPDVVNMVIPDEMYKEKVVEVAEKAFDSNNNISTLKFGENVKTIKNDAFRLAGNIKEIDFNNVEYIDSRSFQGTKKLTHLDTKNIKRIGNAAFNGSGVKTVEFKDSLIEIEDGAFSAAEVEELFTNKVRKIGSGAFYTTPLNKVEFGDSLVKIGSSSFDTSEISELDTNNVRFIGKSAFRNTPLKKVRIGAALETIENGAFESASDIVADYKGIVKLSGEFNAEDKVNRYGPTVRGYKFGFNWIAGEIEGLFDLIPTVYRSNYSNEIYVGYKATKLRESEIEGDPRIVNLEIPDDYYGIPIVELGTGMIRSSEVETIKIGDNVKFINRNALSVLPNLNKVDWGNVEIIGFGNLTWQNKMTEFVAPDSLREIGGDFLYDGHGIKYIDLNKVEVLGNGVLGFTMGNHTLVGTENLRVVGSNTMPSYSGNYLDLSSLEEIGPGSFSGNIKHLKLNRNAQINNAFLRNSRHHTASVPGYIEVDYTEEDQVNTFGPTINGYKFHDDWYAGTVTDDIFAYENISLTYNGEIHHGAKLVGLKSGIKDGDVNLITLTSIPHYTPDGTPVIEIGEQAFLGMKLPSLSSVGENVLKISESAFERSMVSRRLELPNVIELGSRSLHLATEGLGGINSVQVEIGKPLSIVDREAFPNNSPTMIDLVGHFNEDDDKFGPAPVIRGAKLSHRVVANAKYTFDVLEYELAGRDFVIKGFKDWVTPDDPRVKNLTISNIQFDVVRPTLNTNYIIIAENAFNNEVGAAIETLNIYKYSSISLSGKVLPDNSQLKVLNIMEADSESLYFEADFIGKFEFPNLDAKIISKFNREDTPGKAPHIFNYQFGDKWEAISRDELSESFHIELQKDEEESKIEENIANEIEDGIVEEGKENVKEIDIQENSEENLEETNDVNVMGKNEVEKENLVNANEDNEELTHSSEEHLKEKSESDQDSNEKQKIYEETSKDNKKEVTLPLNLIYKRILTVLLK